MTMDESIQVKQIKLGFIHSFIISSERSPEPTWDERKFRNEKFSFSYQELRVFSLLSSLFAIMDSCGRNAKKCRCFFKGSRWCGRAACNQGSERKEITIFFKSRQTGSEDGKRRLRLPFFAASICEEKEGKTHRVGRWKKFFLLSLILLFAPPTNRSVDGEETQEEEADPKFGGANGYKPRMEKSWKWRIEKINQWWSFFLRFRRRMAGGTERERETYKESE